MFLIVCTLLVTFTYSQGINVEVNNTNTSDEISLFQICLSGSNYGPWMDVSAAIESLSDGYGPQIGVTYGSDSMDPAEYIAWNTYQEVFSPNETIENLIEIYSDLDELNKKFQQINSDLEVYGNLILCQEESHPLCENKIGLSSYAPIKMNSDFNVENIVNYRNASGKNNIRIISSIYVISTTQRADIQQLVLTHIFPNSSKSDSMFFHFDYDDIHVYTYYGSYIAYYDDVDIVYNVTSSPYKWSEKYDNFYLNINDEVTIYMFGLHAICSNEELCVKYLNKAVPETTLESEDEDDEKDETWMIIGIVFIILFGIAVIIAIIICVRFVGIFFVLNRSKESKQGYTKPTEDEDDDDVDINPVTHRQSADV